jgi:hypothetical protein
MYCTSLSAGISAIIGTRSWSRQIIEATRMIPEHPHSRHIYGGNINRDLAPPTGVVTRHDLSRRTPCVCPRKPCRPAACTRDAWQTQYRQVGTLVPRPPHTKQSHDHHLRSASAGQPSNAAPDVRLPSHPQRTAVLQPGKARRLAGWVLWYWALTSLARVARHGSYLLACMQDAG